MIFTPLAAGQDMPLSQVLIEGEGWKEVASGFKFTEGPACDAEGNLFFTDIPNNKIHRLAASDGKLSTFVEESGGSNGLMFGPDGRLFACQNGKKRIVAYQPDGKEEVLAEGVASNDLVLAPGGGLYFTDPPGEKVWHLPAGGTPKVVASGFRPNGVILSPDGGTLVVTDSKAAHLWAFRVEKDGSLTGQEPYYQPMRTKSPEAPPGSDGMTVDRDGRVYVATREGVQVFDPTGRPCGVILKPHAGPLSNVAFAGSDRSVLFATAGDKVFRRQTKVKGIHPMPAK